MYGGASEAFFFCERRRRRRSPSAMREQLKPSVMLIPELDCGHAGCEGTFGPWTDGWSVEAKDQFINDVLDAYESVIGAPGIFRFLQARIHAERRQR